MDTPIGENGAQLSGGQRQRIALARAFLKRAPLLILDEATSALDNESEQAIQSALEGVRATTTIVVITHRLATVQRADWLVVLEGGVVTESGSYQALLAAGGRFAQLASSEPASDPVIKP
jgi:subfamily B ATP-binding cassette protein MsbA